MYNVVSKDFSTIKYQDRVCKFSSPQALVLLVLAYDKMHAGQGRRKSRKTTFKALEYKYSKRHGLWTR